MNKPEFRFIKRQVSGQSLFEVVLALAVVTLIMVGIVILAANSIRNSTFSKNKTLASKYAQEAIEWVRKERDDNNSLFITHVSVPNYCFSTLDWSNVGYCSSGEVIAGTLFQRQGDFSVSSVSGKNIVEALIVVSWSDSQGQHEVRTTTNFSDVREK